MQVSRSTIMFLATGTFTNGMTLMQLSLKAIPIKRRRQLIVCKSDGSVAALCEHLFILIELNF
jgi:hypothetical protein